MNRSFCSIWNASLGAWVAVSETARASRGGRLAPRLTVLAMALGSAPAAQAAPLYWDINGNTAGLGGAGTWNTTNVFWNTNATGTGGTVSAWSNANLDQAIFNGTAGTVTLGAPITVSGLSFGTTGYTITGNTLTLAGGAPTINVLGTQTISSLLSGTTGFTKTGAGTLVINGSNTALTGTIAVNAGVLSVNGDAALGNSSNGVTMAGGTQLTATGSLAASRVITLSGGTVTLSGSTIAARFTGAGGLLVQPGVILNNNASNYTGQTQFTGGPNSTYSFSSIADLGVASALGAPTTVANGTILVSPTIASPTLTYTGRGNSSNRNWISTNASNGGSLTLRNNGTGTLTLTGDIQLNGNGNGANVFNAFTADMALLGVISSSSAKAVNFSSQPTRTITLGGASTYTGNTTISGGTVLAPVLADLGIASSLGTASGASGIITVNSARLSYTGTGASSNRGWSFSIGNGGTISNDGSGALTLSGGIAMNTNGTLGGSFSAAPNTASGVISGVGGLAVNSAGTWSLSGTNTYTGATTINAGTLQAGAAAGGQAFGNGSAVSLANVAGATLDLNGFNQTIGSLAGGGSTGGNVTLGAGILTTGRNNSSTTFAGVISGSGGLTKTGTGVQTLSGTSTYTGATSVNAGTLQAGAAAGGQAFGLNSAVTLANAAGVTLDLNNFDQTIGSLSGSGAAGGNVTLGSGTLTTGGDNTSITYGGVISGAGGITKVGSGVQTLSGTSSYTGATTINAGTLQAGAAAGGQAFGLNSAVTLANVAGATLDLNGFNQTIGSLAGGGATGGNVTLGAGTLSTGGDNTSTTYGGVISGTGGLLKNGSGTMILSGTNSYTGATTVSGGALYINGTQTGATGLTTVSNGATLGGNGTLGGSVAISNGILAPGNSPGTLTINGDLSLTGASLLNYEFGQAGVVGGSFNDLTVVGGKLTLDGTLNIAVPTGGTYGPGLYRIISYGGTLTNNGLDLGTQPAGSVNYLQTSVGGQVNLINTAGLTLNFWDGGTATRNNGVIDGGNGVWQTSAGNDNWTNSTGALNAPYTTGAFSIFAGAPGTVTVDNSLGAVVSGGMQFATSGYVLQGQPITLAGGSNILRVGDGTAPSAGYVATIASDLVGTGGVDKTDLGTLVLTGANSYTGDTTISAGTLQLGNGGAAGSILGNITNNAALAFNRSDMVSFGGIIAGTGTLTKLGAGTLTLSGANTYTGATNVNEGILQAGAAAGAQVFGLNSAVTLANVAGVTLDLNNFDQTIGSLSGGGAAGGNVTLGSGTLTTGGDNTSITYGGVISGAGGITKAGSGVQTLSGTSSYTGATTINAGTLQAGAAAGGQAFGLNSAVTLANVAGATLDLNGFNQTIGSLAGGGATGGAVALGSGTLTTGGDNSSTAFAGIISGTGGITKAGGGVQTLSGTNTYSGATTVNAGILRAGGTAGGQAFGLNSAVTLANVAGATLDLNGFSQTIGSLAGGGATGGAVVLGSGTLTTGGDNTSTIYGGVISGTGGLVKNGSGTLTLSDTSSYTGATTINVGTLQTGAANILGASSGYTVNVSGTLATGGFNQQVAQLTNNGSVNLSNASAGSTLTTTGAYVGGNGVLRLGTAIVGGVSVADRLVLNGAGAAASGNTTIQISNLSGLGTPTTGNGIEVVSGIGGANTTAQTTRDAFQLAGRHVDAGAYEYQLYAADAAGAGQNWFLRSNLTPTAPETMYRAEVPMLSALSVDLRRVDLTMLGNLSRRMGDEIRKGPISADIAPDKASDSHALRAWGRVIDTDFDTRQSGTAQADSQGHATGFQMGTDVLADGDWRAGIYMGDLDSHADVNGNAHGVIGFVGKYTVQSRYLGAYATWMDQSGFYIDTVLQGGRQNYTVHPDGNQEFSGTANSLVVSIEAGKPLPMNALWSIEPQLQLIHHHSAPDDVAISGANVSIKAVNGWIGRLGMRIKGDLASSAGRIMPYAQLNLYRATYSDDSMSFINSTSATTISNPGSYSAKEASLGATLALTSTTSLYGEVGRLWSSGGSTAVRSAVQASLGLKVLW